MFVTKNHVSIGMQFYGWTAITDSFKVGPEAFVSCRCACGVVKAISKRALFHGASKSCGCLAHGLAEIARSENRTLKNRTENRGDATVIFIEHRGTTLECLVDTEDLAKLHGTWHAIGVKSLYAQGPNPAGHGGEVSMHRIICESTTTSPIINHNNHNTLDNRKVNLSAVTRAENGITRRGQQAAIYTGIDIPEPARGPLAERLWKLIAAEPHSGCWFWMGPTDRHGYGRFWAVDKLQLAHRISYSLFRSTIPDGLVLDHLCRTPCCVNPYHLEPVTQTENVQRGMAGVHYGSRTHCSNGHPFTAERTSMRTEGGRRCMECARLTNAEYRLRQKAKNKIKEVSLYE